MIHTWNGCYESSWRGMITADSFAHPAKFSRDLIERIFDHCINRGWLKPNDLVGDPFAGIGTGGITAAYRGLRWVGVELEPRFVDMALCNFSLHKDRWARLQAPCPSIIQGDSRRFAEIVGAVGAVVSSPPYAPAVIHGNHGLHVEKFADPKRVGVTSHAVGKNEMDAYGQSPGQIGALKAGQVDAVVSSPPFETCEGTRDDDFRCDGKLLGTTGKHYGSTQGQIGNAHGETYWQAVAAVYASCYAALKPSGVIALVVKDYVKNRARVPLCDDTARLLEHCGFTVVERVHAMLVKEQRHGDLFEGETVRKTERKSFFRRLAERNGSPEINYEEILFARKP